MKKLIGAIVVKSIGFYLNALSFVSPKKAADKALTIFATPRKGKILEHQKAFLNTAKQEVIYFEDLPIMTYQWKGSKDTILLMHGWESNAHRWHKLIKALKAQDYNIVAIDAPAHGQSGSKQFNALLYASFINETTKKFKPKTVIGHSVGGMASVFFQKIYHYSELKKLVLLGAPSEFINVFKGYTTMLGFNSRLEKQLDQLITERFGNTPSSFSTAKYIKDTAVKGLIIHDKEDKIINYDEALRIANNFKNAEFITTSGLGHSLHHKEVIHHILEFINS